MDIPSQMKNDLTGALVGLARASDSNEKVTAMTYRIMIEGVLATSPELSVGEEVLRDTLQKVRGEKYRLVPDCSVCAAPCGRTADYDMAALAGESPDARAIKQRILSGIRTVAAAVYYSELPGFAAEEVNQIFCEALFMLGYDIAPELLQPTLEKVEKLRQNAQN